MFLLKNCQLSTACLASLAKRVNCQRGKSGYTLIEFLVVLGILVITVGVLTAFLTSVFRGTNKANASAEVKQNGQVVLDSLERQIRGASDVFRPSSTAANYIVIGRKVGGNLHIKCQNGLVGTYNSRIAIAVSSDTAELADSDSNWRSISNDDVKNGVNIINCVITLDEASTFNGQPVPAVVSISFTASSVLTRVDSTASAQFKTKISLRRY